MAKTNQLEAYRSAFDLPSAIEMSQALQAAKVLTWFIARDQRQTVRDLEKQLKELYGLVDRFYDVLDGRNWIFTDNLPTDEVAAALDLPTAAEAEAALIGVIADRLRDRFWHLKLFRHEAMQARRANVERAREHYLAEQWDSCALVLVTVMDGFINDVEPSQRRGLHARDAEEMVAWDSLVGHHKGLTSVMPTFLTTFKKRVDEEVFEVHRHGIVHGNVVNYDNQIVATKAWNMLHAVVDWAAAQAKPPPEPKPTWQETFSLLADHGRDQRYRKDYRSWRVNAEDPAFEANEVVVAATRFLEAWQAKRWGLVWPFMPPCILRGEQSDGKRALYAKEVYEGSELTAFELTSASSDSASVATVLGQATIDGQTRPIAMRWTLVAPDGSIAFADQTDARWVLAVFPPRTFIADVHA